MTSLWIFLGSHYAANFSRVGLPLQPQFSWGHPPPSLKFLGAHTSPLPQFSWAATAPHPNFLGLTPNSPLTFLDCHSLWKVKKKLGLIPNYQRLPPARGEPPEKQEFFYYFLRLLIASRSLKQSEILCYFLKLQTASRSLKELEKNSNSLRPLAASRS